MKRIREEEYLILEEKYLLDEVEVRKIIANKNKYVQFDSENEDVRTFMELSKNISQLEKGIFTEDSMEAMYIFGDYEEEPRSKDLKEKLVGFFKEHRGMFFLGVFVVSFSSVIVSIEEGFINLRRYVKKKIYMFYLKKKDEVKEELKKEFKKKEKKVRKEFEKKEKKYEAKSLRLIDTLLGKIIHICYIHFCCFNIIL